QARVPPQVAGTVAWFVSLFGAAAWAAAVSGARDRTGPGNLQVSLRVTSSPAAMPQPELGERRSLSDERRNEMILLVVLALLAIVAFGVGFTLHWLFIVAAVLALVWLIGLFAGGVGGRSRGAWW